VRCADVPEPLLEHSLILEADQMAHLRKQAS
jgi:hypothetical protein